MDFSLTADQQNIREAILKHCSGFPDAYWLERDREGVFPHEFYKSMVEGGWLGIAMPAEFGGSGLGITEAAVMMQAIAESGAGMSGASSVHMPVFGLQPVVLFGTQRAEGADASSCYSRGTSGLLCGHRAQCGAQHDGAQDPRGTARRRLSGERREDLDLHRAGREQDASPGAHHAARPGQAQDGRALAVLHEPGSVQDRGAPDPQDGAARGGFERALHRGSVGPGGGQDRPGRGGLQAHPPRPQPGARLDRRRSGRHRPRRRSPGPQAMRASTSCSTGRSA